MKNTKKYIALAVSAVFILGMFCACGSTEGDASEEAETTAKATVTAGEAAEQEAQDKADKDATQEPTTRKKTGTEDPAIDAVKAAAYEDIKGFDGKWNNISVDVDDLVTTIEFDWKGTHYKYEYDQETNEIIR